MLNDGINRLGCGWVLTDKTTDFPPATFAGVFVVKCVLFL